MSKTSTPPDVAKFLGLGVVVLQSTTKRDYGFDPAVGTGLCVTAVSFRPVAIGQIIRHTGGSFAVAWNEPGKPSGSSVHRRKIVSFAADKPVPDCARDLYGDTATVFGFARETEFFAVMLQNAELDQWFSIQQKALKLGIHVSAGIATDVGLAKDVGKSLVMATSDLIRAYRDAEIAENRIRRLGVFVDKLRDSLRQVCPDLFNPDAPNPPVMYSLSLPSVHAIAAMDLRMPFDLVEMRQSLYGLPQSVMDEFAAAIAADFAAADKEGGSK